MPWRRLLDRVHGQLPNILLRVEEDDVELGAVQAEQRHVGAQADRDAEGRQLDLRRNLVSVRDKPRGFAAKDKLIGKQFKTALTWREN